MKKILVFSLLLLSANAFAGKYVPIHTGLVNISQKVSDQQVKAAVKKALVSRGWTLEEESGKGRLNAKIVIRSHTAKVRIEYNAEKVVIHYVSSTNLGYKEKKKKGPMIHRNYNNWIKNLEKDIRVHLIDATH